MRSGEKSATRREFVKDAAVGVAGISIMGSLGAMANFAQETKHGHLIRKIVYRNDDWKRMGPGNADYIWWPTGVYKAVNFSFGYYTRIGDWHTNQPGGHYHPDGDEALIYVGLDPENPERLHAECEHDCGKEYE